MTKSILPPNKFNKIKTMFPLISFFLFSLLASQTKSVTETEALLKWKSTLHNPKSLESWSLSNSTSPCDWYGITCDKTGTVAQLILPNSGLNGSLNELDFSSLPQLTHLDLSNNYPFLQGFIPPNISYLTNLVSLDLSHNGLTGLLPGSIGTLHQLEYLNIAMNGITGSIPDEIGNLTNLTELYLVYNSFTDPIPHTIGNLTRLNVLNLGSNQLIGNIPSELSNLGLLTVLNLSTNFLSVPIPSFIVNFSQLESLDLSGLNLHGKMVELFVGHDEYLSWNFSSMPKMKYLFLRDNFLSGNIPSFFCKMDSLIALDLSRNQLSGKLPQCWWEVKKLQMMILESNNLSGNIPKSRGRMPPLLSIHLANNSLIGEFPSALKNCSDLVVLDIGKNGFFGEIPEWIGYSFPSLKIFSLRSNLFNGSIPPLNGLSKLQLLDFSDNNLIGNIPPSVGNLTSMNILQQSTLIDGSNFGYMESISIMWKGTELSFQQNLAMVTGVDFSSNSLSREIPIELTSLFGLLFLNLSRNHLTGGIPEKIGDLQQLESLDLSNNEISGVIPASIGNLGFLSFLNLSYNNLSGKIPAGNQMQTLDNPLTYVGNEGLCGFPLAKACLIYESSIQNKKLTDGNDDKIEKILFYGFIVFGFAFGFWTFFGVLFFKKTWRHNYFYFIDNMQQKISEKMKII